MAERNVNLQDIKEFESICKKRDIDVHVKIYDSVVALKDINSLYKQVLSEIISMISWYNGPTYAGDKHFAEKVGCSYRSIQKIIKDLKNKGYITVETYIIDKSKRIRFIDLNFSIGKTYGRLPDAISKDRSITPLAKIIYSMIDSFSINKSYFNKPNEFFSSILDVSIIGVKKALQELKEAKLIQVILNGTDELSGKKYSRLIKINK